MQMRISPYSTYDCLSLIFKLQKLLGDVAEEELQMFSYLACLLSLYDGNNLAYWNYNFIKNDLGAPYSSSLNNTVKILINSGSLKNKNGYLQLSVSGFKNLEVLEKFNMNLKREKYLTASVSCINYSPYSTVKEALFKEPVLSDSISFAERKNLIDEEDISLRLLYEQFGHLHNALKGKFSEHLIVPAMTWLSFLSKHQIG